MALSVLLGGARSGKSTLAVRRAHAYAGPVCFIATAAAATAASGDSDDDNGSGGSGRGGSSSGSSGSSSSSSSSSGSSGSGSSGSSRGGDGGEMAARIARHRAERPAQWQTVEEPLQLEAALAGAQADALVIVDCLTLWVSNQLAAGADDEAIEAHSARAARCAAQRSAPTIAVSNEVGMGIVPMNALARRFRDVHGRVNAGWVAQATDASLVVAGALLALTPAGPPSVLGGAQAADCDPIAPSPRSERR
jgi:adenosylcobinamide kinase/adenosylcobinamide-phosphate guanylyltransferase